MLPSALWVNIFVLSNFFFQQYMYYLITYPYSPVDQNMFLQTV